MMRKNILSLLLLLLFVSYFAHGEVLVIDNGSILNGKIIKMDEDTMTILSEFGEMVIDRDKIKRIYQNMDEYNKEKEVKTETKIIEKIIEKTVTEVKMVVDMDRYIPTKHSIPPLDTIYDKVYEFVNGTKPKFLNAKGEIIEAVYYPEQVIKIFRFTDNKLSDFYLLEYMPQSGHLPYTLFNTANLYKETFAKNFLEKQNVYTFESDKKNKLQIYGYAGHNNGVLVVTHYSKDLEAGALKDIDKTLEYYNKVVYKQAHEVAVSFMVGHMMELDAFWPGSYVEYSYNPGESATASVSNVSGGME